MPKMFNVMDVEQSQLLRDGDTPSNVMYGNRCWHNSIRVFPNAAAANETCALFTERCRRKFQPRPIRVSDVEWHQRELTRLMDGTYIQLPWIGLRASDQANGGTGYDGEWAIHHRKPEAVHHFPHLSRKVPGNIAFTADADKGSADIQTVMKPGRYLKTFYHLEQGSIRSVANALIAQYGTCELKFAHTEDEIEAVYTNGPSSCMSHKAREFGGCKGYHPVRIYGAGDLAVAYLVIKSATADGDDDDKDEIAQRASARTLCWPKNKLYGRIYGDTQKMEHFMQQAGYTEAPDWYFEGAKMLRKLTRNGHLIMPYLDGESKRARDDGKHIIIDSAGPINCEVTGGSTDLRRSEEEDDEHDDQMCCSHCDNWYPEDDGIAVRRSPGNHVNVFICEDCRGDTVFFCDYSGQHYYDPSGDDTVAMGNGRTWHGYYVERHAFRSVLTNEYFPMEARVTMGNGEYWAAEELNGNATQSATGTWWNTGDEPLVAGPDGGMYHPSELAKAVEDHTSLLAAVNETMTAPVLPIALETNYASIEQRLDAMLSLSVPLDPGLNTGRIARGTHEGER